MRPGPMIAARVRSRRRQVRRGVTSLTRMVPNAPWMSAGCRSSTTADVGFKRESLRFGSRSDIRPSYSGARCGPVAPILGNQCLDDVVRGDRTYQVAGRVDDREGGEVVVGHHQGDVGEVGVAVQRDHRELELVDLACAICPKQLDDADAPGVLAVLL